MSLPLVHLKTKADTVSDTFCLDYETVKAVKHADSVWERGAEEKVWNWWEREQTECQTAVQNEEMYVFWGLLGEYKIDEAYRVHGTYKKGT